MKLFGDSLYLFVFLTFSSLSGIYAIWHEECLNGNLIVKEQDTPNSFIKKSWSKLANKTLRNKQSLSLNSWVLITAATQTLKLVQYNQNLFYQLDTTLVIPHLNS